MAGLTRGPAGPRLDGEEWGAMAADNKTHISGGGKIVRGDFT